MLRTGDLKLRDLEPLEQVDVLAVEERELSLRYFEQSTAIMATAKSPEMAAKFCEALRNEYFIGYKAQEEQRKRIDVDELRKLQEYTYVMARTAVGGALEMRRKSP